MECLALEVGGEGSLAERIVLQRNVAVGGEGTGEDGDVSKDRFEGFVQDAVQGAGGKRTDQSFGPSPFMAPLPLQSRLTLTFCTRSFVRQRAD